MLTKSLALAAALAAVAAIANAETHEVEMLNMGADGMMVFEPAFVAAEPGDTITFVPTDKSHNAEVIEGMLPEGADAFKGPANKEFSVTLDKEGIYGVRCAPHYGMGMVMAIQVGAPTNLEAAKSVKHPGMAAKRMDAVLTEVE